MMFDGNALEPRWRWWARVLASALIVMSLHAGLVAYAYLMPPPEEVVEEDEGAFMLEVTPVVVTAAIDAVAMPLPPAPATQAQVDEKKPTEEVPEVTPPKVEVPLPVAPDPELAMPIQKPIEEPKEEKEEEVEKPLPKVEVKEKDKEREKPEKEEAKAQQAMIEATQSTPSERKAAEAAVRRRGTTDRRSDQAQTWARALFTHLSNKRRPYPKAADRAGHEGVVLVRFTVDRSGNVLSAQVSKTSQSRHLDVEAVEMLHHASPLPRPPDDLLGETFEYNVPITFRIRR